MEGEQTLVVVVVVPMTCGVISLYVCIRIRTVHKFAQMRGSFFFSVVVRQIVSPSPKKFQKSDQTEDRTQDLIRSAAAVKDT